MKRIIQREGETSLRRGTGQGERACRVLVADDNDFMRHCVRLLLLREGCEVIDSAEDGMGLVSISQLHEHDLIITDFRMPGMDGLQAARTILARQPDSRIIMLTSDNDSACAHAALDLGITGYVLKDRMIPDLPLAISAVMSGNTFLSPTIDSAACKPLCASAGVATL